MVKSGKVFNYLTRSNEDFYWGGALNSFNEIYIAMAFGVCINTSSLTFDSPSDIINQVFMILMGLALVLVPILLIRNLHKTWKQISQASEILDYKEGGESTKPPKRQSTLKERTDLVAERDLLLD